MVDAGEHSDTTPEVPPLRYLGDSGPELDVIPPEEASSFGDVMILLVDAALEAKEKTDKGLDPAFAGETVAQIFCRGDVEDPRVSFLVLLIAQVTELSGEVVLAVAEEAGLGDLVEQARIAREELARVGDVSVEEVSLSAASFHPGSLESSAPAEAAQP